MSSISQCAKCLFVLLWISAIGCDQTSNPTATSKPVDVGATYVFPIGTGPRTIDGIEYEYVAVSEREKQIIEGFSKLNMGQTREEVRAAMGDPDFSQPMYRKSGDTPFIGWGYKYYIMKRSHGPNENDIRVQIFVNSEGKLHWAVPHVTGLTEIGSPGAH